jgi:N-acetylneuraminate lyase
MKGIFSALLVPFDENGDVMEKELREIIRYNIDVIKIDGLYVNGSTGECFMLYPEEKKQILEIAIDEAKDEIELIAQVGSLNVKEAVDVGKYATELGYKALSAVTPFYYKFTFEEIKGYYETIINETNNNMIVYCIPSKTGVGLDFSQLKQLFMLEKVIGIKYTDNDFFLLERIRKEFPDKIIYSGFDQMQLSATVLGVDGSIGTTFNLIGARAKKIFHLVQNQKLQEAAKLQSLQNDFIQKLSPLGLFPAMKELFKLKGINAGYCRQPFGKFDKSKMKELEKLVLLCD